MFGYQKRVTIYKLEFGIKKYTVIHSITSPELFLCAYTTLFVHIYIHTHSYIYICTLYILHIEYFSVSTTKRYGLTYKECMN